MPVTEPSETVAVRLPKSIIARVDALAADAGRTRSNFLARLITRSVDDRALLSILQPIIEGIQRDEAPGGDSYSQEFGRGQFHAAKWVINALLGEARKDELLNSLRRNGTRIPHVVGRYEDGSRPGFDMDAG